MLYDCSEVLGGGEKRDRGNARRAPFERQAKVCHIDSAQRQHRDAKPA
jgi:hypothetical protein